MQQLHLTAVHEDGGHLVLTDGGGEEYLLPVDERLRAAVRRPVPSAGPAGAAAAPLRPRQVQAMIRAGLSAQEVAEATGWPQERVERFEAPILAERRHVAEQARRASVRGRSPEGGIATLESRVLERLTARGVDVSTVRWDSSRPEGGSWTVLLVFSAAGRTRTAAWTYEPVGRTVEALDDEARWLSEDEQALPGSATSGSVLGPGGSSSGESVDLMTAMRERSRTRGRRGRKTTTPVTDPAHVPGAEEVPDTVLPLEDLHYDPESMGLPPGARGELPAPAGESEAEPEASEVEEDAEATGPPEATLEDFFGPADDDYEDEDDEAYDSLDVPVADDGDAVAAGSDPEPEPEPAPEPVASEQPDGTDQPETTGGEEEPGPPSPSGRRGRPSVPSWDDIMFGAKNRGR